VSIVGISAVRAAGAGAVEAAAVVPVVAVVVAVPVVLVVVRVQLPGSWRPARAHATPPPPASERTDAPTAMVLR
jgi:hypothetical protein